MKSLIDKLKEIDEKIKITPNEELYRERAIIYNKLEKFDLAMNDYDNIIKLDSNDYNAYYDRACEWYNWKIYYLDELPPEKEIEENTIHYLKKAINIKETPKCYYRMAEIYFNLLDENEQSLKYCEKALVIEEDEKEKVEILKLLGEIYNELGEYNNAIEIFNSILKDNEDADAFLFRGISYYNLANDEDNIENCEYMYKRALEDYKHTVNLDTENIFAYIKMAQILNDVFHEIESCAKCYKKIIELEPSNEEANEFMANYYYDMNDYKSTIEYINNIGDLDSDLDYLESRKAECYYELGKYTDALNIYNKVLDLKKDKRIYDYRGDIYLKLGEYDKAISDYKKFIKAYPESKGVYYRLGMVYAQKGDKENALKMLTKALELLPGNEKIIYLINDINNIGCKER